MLQLIKKAFEKRIWSVKTLNSTFKLIILDNMNMLLSLLTHFDFASVL